MNPREESSPDELRRVRAGHIELAVVDRGRGMPLVLVHGFPLDHTMWEPQIARFSAGYRVIAPDLRGFGHSPATDAPVSMETMADDVAALLDALEVRQPVVLCGLSMGGYVAFQFARKYGQRLRGLVLCNTRAAADSAEAVAQRRRMAEHVLASGTEYLTEIMLPKVFAEATFRDNPAVIDHQRRAMARAPVAGIVAALDGLARRPDVHDLLPSIRVPTLVVAGQLDAISPPEEMRAFAGKIPGAKFVVLPGCAHMTPLESPQAFNAELARFLEALPPV